MKLSVSNGIFDGINRDDDMLMFGIKNMVDKIESMGAKAKVFKQAPSQFNDPKKLFFISGMASPKDALKSLSISTSIHNKRREKLNSKFLDEIGSARLIEIDEIFVMPMFVLLVTDSRAFISIPATSMTMRRKDYQ